MATILEFAERLAGGDDWTPGERAQLREIGSQLSGALYDVELVFGVAECGDPWCAVVDASGEVLLHIARIDGAFVVYSAYEDRAIEGPNLWGAASRLLGDLLRERRGVVLPFHAEEWAPPAALALFLAVALRDDYHEVLHGAFGPAPDHPAAAGTETSAAATPAAHAIDAPPPDHAPLSSGRADGAVAGLGHDSSVEASPAHGRGEQVAANDLHERPDVDAARFASAHDDHGAAAARLVPRESLQGRDATGHAANDHAPVPNVGTPRVVAGGEGADRLALGPDVIVQGKGGADVFVAHAPGPAPAGAQPTFAGFVADMKGGEGDRIVFAGKAATLVGQETVGDVLAGFRASGGNADLPAVAGRRLNYDVNGDGRADAFVFTTENAGAWLDTLPNTGVSGGGASHYAPAATVSPPGLGGPSPPPLSDHALPEPPAHTEVVGVAVPDPSHDYLFS